MKQAMSAFDLRAVAMELREHVGSFVKKSYMPHYEQVVLRMNPRDVEAFDLVIVRGRRLSTCLLYTSPSPRDRQKSRMPSSA